MITIALGIILAFVVISCWEFILGLLLAAVGVSVLCFATLVLYVVVNS